MKAEEPDKRWGCETGLENANPLGGPKPLTGVRPEPLLPRGGVGWAFFLPWLPGSVGWGAWGSDAPAGVESTVRGPL